MRLTLKELTNAALEALRAAEEYDGVANGQVRSMPDSRTIRYYRTIGLLDKPVGHKGRAALYGRQHLLQLVAIKRLQAEGLSLKQVQQRLHGLPQPALEELARLPRGGEPASAKAPQRPSRPRQRRSEGRFWSPTAATHPDAEPAASVPEPLQGLPVAAGITLLASLARPLEQEDWQAILEAAQPLMKVLKERGLLQG